MQKKVAEQKELVKSINNHFGNVIFVDFRNKTRFSDYKSWLTWLNWIKIREIRNVK